MFEQYNHAFDKQWKDRFGLKGFISPAFEWKNGPFQSFLALNWHLAAWRWQWNCDSDVSWPYNLRISPWFQKDKSLEEQLLRWNSSLIFITRSVSFQPKIFSTKCFHVQSLGATVNDKQSSPSDARRLGSKQTEKD